MSSINGKFPSRRRVLQVFGGHGPQNQNHQREQNRPNPDGQNANAADGFVQNPVPRHNVVIDSGNFVPGAGANYYKTAQWEVEAAKPNANVRINAELHGSVPDGTTVVINVIHHLSQTQKNVYDTITGVINKGLVSASWQTKAKGGDWNKGFFTFMIIGGRASRESTNTLRLA